MATPRELGNQPNTIEAWTTTGDWLTAIRIQALGHLLYNLILKASLSGRLDSVFGTYNYSIEDELAGSLLSESLAQSIKTISEKHPFNAALIRHWLDLASREIAFMVLGKGKEIADLMDSEHSGVNRIQSAQRIVIKGIETPLRDHIAIYQSAEALDYSIYTTIESRLLLNEPIQSEEFSEEDLTLRSFTPNWTGTDERYAENRRRKLEEQRKRAEREKKSRQEGIALQQGHTRVYEFLNASLEGDPFDEDGIFYRAANELGYGVKVLERRPEDYETEEVGFLNLTKPMYMIVVDSQHTDTQLDAIRSLLWRHKGWKFIDLVDEASSLDLLELYKGKESSWFTYANLGEPIRDRDLLKKGFIRAEIRRRNIFSGMRGMDREYVRRLIENKFQ